MIKSLLIDFKGSYRDGDNYTFWYNVEHSAKVSTDIHVLNYGNISKASCWFDVLNRRLYVNGVEGYFSMAGHTMTFVSVPDPTNEMFNFLNGTSFNVVKSGNPIQFVSPAAQEISALSVTITPIQEGTGEPSPTNIRPISGISSVSVTRTDGEGGNSAVVTIPLVDSNNDPLIVYGGTLNFITGKLDVTWTAKRILSSMAIRTSNTWNSYLSTAWAISNFFTGGAQIPGYDVVIPVKCSHLSVGTPADIAGVYNAYRVGYGDNYSVFFRFPEITTLDDMRGYLDAENVMVAYPLSSPVTYQLTAAQLTTIEGTNIVTTNADSVIVETLAKFEV